MRIQRPNISKAIEQELEFEFLILGTLGIGGWLEIYISLFLVYILLLRGAAILT
jgi:hypothetical protein